MQVDVIGLIPGNTLVLQNNTADASNLKIFGLDTCTSIIIRTAVISMVRSMLQKLIWFFIMVVSLRALLSAITLR